MYIRLTFSSVEIYRYLETLYQDYRKLRYMNRMGQFELLHMDEFIDHLLRDDGYCDIQLPRLQVSTLKDFLESISSFSETTGSRGH